MNLIKILLGLALALLILVPLLQRLDSGNPNPKLAKLTQWLFPLIALVLVLQLLFYFLK